MSLIFGRDRMCRTGLFWLPAAFLLLFAPACAIESVPDDGDCVLASPLTCNKLTPLLLGQRPRILLDTDAQFQGDPTTARQREQGSFGDQLALIYMLLRSDRLQLVGVTTANANDGSIDEQVSEVRRVAKMCGEPGIPIKRGAIGTYTELQGQLGDSFEGEEAVDFIIAQARSATPNDPLVILLGTKATNVALALTKDPSIAPNIDVHWTATDEPGSETSQPPGTRPGGSGMYNIEKDPEAANYLLAAPIELHLLRLWNVDPTPSTQPRFNTAAAGMGVKQAADLPCMGPRVAPVTIPDGRVVYTAGSYASVCFTTFGGNGTRTMDEASLAVLLARSELAEERVITAPDYDQETETMVFPESGPHEVYVYDAVQSTAVGEEFLGALSDPFVSCAWPEGD
jgi:hypothetical protein